MQHFEPARYVSNFKSSTHAATKLLFCKCILLMAFSYYFVCECFCLFDLMLFIHGKQLRSFWDCQFLNHIVPTKAPSEAFYCTNITVHILSALSDSWLFLNQRKGKPFTRKDVSHVKVGTASIRTRHTKLT